MRESLAAYCARHHRRDLLDQWDGSRNGTLTPDTVSYGGRQKLWWRCEQGHVWQAAVYTRAGERAAAPTAPASAPGRGLTTWPPGSLTWPRSGTPPRTGDLTPDQVLWGKNRRVWWQCAHGHVWDARSSPGRRGGLPLLRQPADQPWGQRLGRPIPPTWPPSGTPPRMGTCGPRTWWPAAAGRSGGSAPRAMYGRRPLPPGPAEAQAARCAPASRWCLVRTTWPPSSPSWPSSGTGRRMGPSRPSRSPRTATAPPGGGARWGTAGGRPSVPGLGERLPLLRRPKGPAGVQRPGHPGPCRGGGVGPGPQRGADAPDGDRRRPQKSLVAVPGKPCVEGRGLLPHRS